MTLAMVLPFTLAAIAVGLMVLCMAFMKPPKPTYEVIDAHEGGLIIVRRTH